MDGLAATQSPEKNSSYVKHGAEDPVMDVGGNVVPIVDDPSDSLGNHRHLAAPSKPSPRSHTPPERDTNVTTTKLSSTATPVSTVSVSVVPAPPSMAFTIDFGADQDSPEITNRWKQFTPYRVHSGIALRSSEKEQRERSKGKLNSKSESVDVGGNRRSREGASVRFCFVFVFNNCYIVQIL